MRRMFFGTAAAILVAFALLAPVASTALEATAVSREVQAASALDMKLDTVTSALRTTVNFILTCNNKQKLFASDASTPGRDADGCIDLPSAAPPAPTPTALPRLALVAEVESYNTTPSPWIEAQACAVTRARFTTTQDNHAHDCYIERSGTRSRIYATHEGRGGVHSACRMACYNIVP